MPRKVIRDSEIGSTVLTQPKIVTEGLIFGQDVNDQWNPPDVDTAGRMLSRGLVWSTSLLDWIPAQPTVPTGGATEAKQDDTIDAISNKDVMLAVRRLLQLIASPGYVDKTANQIRAQVTGTATVSGSLTTVTTVTGLTNLNSYAANLPVIDINRLAWANVVRARIT